MGDNEEKTSVQLDKNLNVILNENSLDFQSNIVVAYEHSSDLLLNITPSNEEDGGQVLTFLEQNLADKNTCLECGKIFLNIYRLKQHSKVHSLRSKSYKCSICPKSYYHKESMLAHEKAHTGIKNFKCKSCDMKFADKSTLVKHTKIHSGYKPHVCEICQKKFLRTGDLNIHKRVHNSDRKKYVCKWCNKTYTSNSTLIVHEKGHLGIRPFECGNCRKMFSTSSQLKKHVLRSSCHLNRIKCEYCTMKFNSHEKVEFHTKKMHLGLETPFQCQLCEKSFKRNCDLEVHNRVHSGSKPYECKLCDKSFTTSGNLRLHEGTHTGEKKYQCSECGKTYARSGKLKLHSMIHSGQKSFCCQECGKLFYRKDALNSHLKVHTNRSSDHQCNKCGNLFSSHAYLGKHELKCTGTGGKSKQSLGKKFRNADESKSKVKKYQCLKCGIFTKRESDLSYHKKHGCLDFNNSSNEQTGETEHVTGESEHETEETDHLTEETDYATEETEHETENVKTESIECLIMVNNVSELMDISKVVFEVKGNNLKPPSEVRSRPKRKQCPHCGKRFSAPSQLVTHLRIHTGVRPFNCGKCQKAFNRKGNLDTHMANVHKIEQLIKPKRKNVIQE